MLSEENEQGRRVRLMRVGEWPSKQGGQARPFREVTAGQRFEYGRFEDSEGSEG